MPLHLLIFFGGVFLWLSGTVYFWSCGSFWAGERSKAWKKPVFEVPVEFPPSFRHLFRLQIFFLVASIFVGSIGIPLLLLALQREFYSSQALYFWATETFLAFSFPCLLLGVLGWTIVLASILRFYPFYDKYQALEEMVHKQRADKVGRDNLRARFWETVNWQAVTAGEKSSAYKWMAGIWLICLPFLILGMDSYAFFTPKGLVVNRYWSLEEKRYSWKQITGASLYGVWGSSKSGPNLCPGFTVDFGRGEEYVLLSNQSTAITIPWDEAIGTARLLRQNGVQVTVFPLTPRQERNLAQKFQWFQDGMHRLWREVSALPGVEIGRTNGNKSLASKLSVALISISGVLFSVPVV